MHNINLEVATMKKSIYKSIAAALTLSLALTALAGCQSTTTVTPDNIRETESIENKYTKEQLEIFNLIYDTEHSEEAVELMGEDDAFENEKSVVSRYVELEGLPENGLEMYLSWRETTHS